MSPAAAFHDLPPECYPLDVIAYRVSDGAEVWREHITEPCALYVPPLALEHGRVRIRVEYGDGTVEE